LKLEISGGKQDNITHAWGRGVAHSLAALEVESETACQTSKETIYQDRLQEEDTSF
jgi:hypothetical protein